MQGIGGVGDGRWLVLWGECDHCENVRERKERIPFNGRNNSKENSRRPSTMVRFRGFGCNLELSNFLHNDLNPVMGFRA